MLIKKTFVKKCIMEDVYLSSSTSNQNTRRQLCLMNKNSVYLYFSVNIYEIIKFPNDVCVGATKNGTCYTAMECANRGGNNAGTCASGFGVCCECKTA